MERVAIGCRVSVGVRRGPPFGGVLLWSAESTFSPLERRLWNFLCCDGLAAVALVRVTHGTRYDFTGTLMAECRSCRFQPIAIGASENENHLRVPFQNEKIHRRFVVAERRVGAVSRAGTRIDPCRFADPAIHHIVLVDFQSDGQMSVASVCRTATTTTTTATTATTATNQHGCDRIESNRSIDPCQRHCLHRSLRSTRIVVVIFFVHFGIAMATMATRKLGSKKKKKEKKRKTYLQKMQKKNNRLSYCLLCRVGFGFCLTEFGAKLFALSHLFTGFYRVFHSEKARQSHDNLLP